MTTKLRGAPRPLPVRPETIRRRGSAATTAVLGQSTVFIEGLALDAQIGVHPHEMGRTQPILVDVAVDLGAMAPPQADRLGETYDYQAIAKAVAAIVAEGHVQLVETLAERIAAWCLEDRRVREVTVRIAKPEALAEAAAAGCKIVRRRG